MQNYLVIAFAFPLDFFENLINNLQPSVFFVKLSYSSLKTVCQVCVAETFFLSEILRLATSN